MIQNERPSCKIISSPKPAMCATEFEPRENILINPSGTFTMKLGRRIVPNPERGHNKLVDLKRLAVGINELADCVASNQFSIKLSRGLLTPMFKS